VKEDEENGWKVQDLRVVHDFATPSIMAVLSLCLMTVM
jgi:hypothetical protein